ncbi:MAG: ABC transporter substrate-binding protein [Gammaproteobacteria bacterium]|jgi:microcin C transport system substrate-binding protein|nr:ABC transporter substrate-binding protein [Gammaproteobacteria bacterium]MBT5205077.1 ABC transporter substrate-binding protein [Gammaproteobacteria bacterium]MBT5603961.1 ABC transporter substrate-binding protein [Gammaproteobacteria bacterium]MBT6244031.1 ABC transporter substrate-binding protein [Gammaproteobacteria bacterium]
MNSPIPVLLIPLLILCVSCSESENQQPNSELAINNTQEVLDYYASNPEFFRTQPLAELPEGLVWQDGSALSEIGSPEAKKGGSEYVRIQDFPRTLRTVGPDSNGSFRPWILDNVAMSLAHRHPNQMDFFPGLATAWAIDEKTKTVFVKLDPNAHWSDGDAITADDYFFTFWFNRSPYITAPWYNNYYHSQFTGITKYDDHLIAVSIPELKPDTDAKVLGLSPLPQHFYSEVGDDFIERYQWRFAPTTGAYVIRDGDLKKGRSVRLSRDPNWWAKNKRQWRYRYNVDAINLTVIRDTPKEFEAFKRGDLDQISLNLAEYWYEKLPDQDPDVAAGYIEKKIFYNQRPRPPYGLWINTSQPLLDDLNIRLGIQSATNWQLVIDKFFRGDYQRLSTANDGYGRFSHPSIEARKFDIPLAQDYFAEAGFKQRNSDGILERSDGTRLSFTLSSGYESLKDVLTILKEEAAKAGLDYRIEVLDGTSGWKKVQEKQHDLHFSAFGYSLELYPRFWETYYSSNAYDEAFDDSGNPNPNRKLKTQTNNLETFAVFEMDQLIDAYRSASNEQEMIQLAHEMSELHHDYGSFVPGFYQGFFRMGFWRWVRYPEEFSYRHASSARSLFVHWIDPELKKETQRAKEEGITFTPGTRIYDRYRN